PRAPGPRIAPRSRGQYAPSRIRTCGLLLRRESLYPAELSGPAPRGYVGHPLPKHVPLTGRYAPRPTVRDLALRDGRRRPSWSESTLRPRTAASVSIGVESRRAGM